MSNKYNELPESTVNYFKPGDLFVIYNEYGRSDIKEVFEVDGDYVYFKNGFKYKNHFKQCRKVIKQEPKVLYVDTCFSYFGVRNDLTEYTTKVCKVSKPGLVKYIEVLEE